MGPHIICLHGPSSNSITVTLKMNTLHVIFRGIIQTAGRKMTFCNANRAKIHDDYQFYYLH